MDTKGLSRNELQHEMNLAAREVAAALDSGKEVPAGALARYRAATTALGATVHSADVERLRSEYILGWRHAVSGQIPTPAWSAAIRAGYDAGAIAWAIAREEAQRYGAENG